MRVLRGIEDWVLSGPSTRRLGWEGAHPSIILYPIPRPRDHFEPRRPEAPNSSRRRMEPKMPRNGTPRETGLGSIVLGLVLMGAMGHEMGDREGVRVVAGYMGV